ncbi:batten's disease protein Cln3 [Stachybotrys elegans]|uniref:Protein BTN n=1 Tax=Stachybotrys elegans TaxID=80388 RepID=A0A8K0STL1_9HYPO|nr:batten's disease protein Cln3 [Stachybotrys elegans]
MTLRNLVLPPRGWRIDEETRAFTAFAVLGFTTTTVAPIVYAAAYLIIPFPRAVVVLIETLPALAVKLLLPHVLFVVPLWTRPLAIAAGWLVASVVIDYVAPNVHPPVRVLLTLLVAAAKSASEVSFLVLARNYGTVGLSGWGAGMGAGGAAIAVMPYMLTHRWGLFLRSAVGYNYYLIPLMLLAYYVLLPQPGNLAAPPNADKDDLEEHIGGSALLLMQDPVSQPMPLHQRIRQNLRLASSLISPYMTPLFSAMAIQAVIFPGITRSLGVSSLFKAYAGYYAGYGLFFHLGNLIGCISILGVRFQKPKPLLVRLGLVGGFVLLSAVFLFLSIPVVMFLVVLTAGLLCGAVYSNVFLSVMTDAGSGAATDREFSLGIVGAGVTAGLLFGGVLGALLESGLCGLGLGSGQRWCHLVK